MDRRKMVGKKVVELVQSQVTTDQHQRVDDLRRIDFACGTSLVLKVATTATGDHVVTYKLSC